MIRYVFRLLTGSLLLLCLGGLLFSMLGASPVAATSGSPYRPTAPQADPQGHATILVLDMSGSMGTNDPQGYRCSAADAYIDLSAERDFIGLVGLDGNGSRTGAHNFEAANAWADPQSTATVQQKQTLKDTIAQKSNHCQPHSTTPTYDALSQAYTLLDTFTQKQAVSGASVILLTDGAPCSDVDAQVSAIRDELVPKFHAKGWPIDTIALGKDAALNSPDACSAAGSLPGTLHDFLRSVAGGTNGKYYDDGVGPVPGISPLNIAGFFVDIFARYSGETPSLAIGVTQLNGDTFQRNFPVVDGTTKLDIVAVKESKNVQVAMANPFSQPIDENTAGVLVSQDDFHVIYSVADPPSGDWIATASGNGQFLLYSLTKTDIAVKVDQVAVPHSSLVSTQEHPIALPLGQTLEITAHLERGGHPFSDNIYSLNGDISIDKTSCAQPSLAVALNDRNADSYKGSVKVPAHGNAGTYSILVCASTGSLQNVVASVSFAVPLEVFPIPSLYSAQTKQYTDTSDAPLNTTVVQWPLPLQLFYSIPVLNRLSGWPLQGFPAQPDAVLPGEVQWNGQPYKGASIRATAVAVRDCVPGIPAQTNVPGALPVTVDQDGQGHFTAFFQPSGPGLYQIIFETSGSFNDSQGSFGPQGLCVNANLRGATFDETKTASLVTLFYLFLLTALFSLGWFLATPRPFGKWVRDQGSTNESNRSFASAQRLNLFALLYKRNQLTSRSVGMPQGLLFRFRRSKRIDVRPAGSGSNDWRMSDGSRLPHQFLPIQELVYRPPEAADTDYDAYLRYTIHQTTRGGGGGGGGGGGYSGGNYRDDDDDEYSGYRTPPRQKPKGRGQRSTPSYSYDDYSAPRRGRSSRGRKRQDLASWDRYDD